jgi:hypothetical protein
VLAVHRHRRVLILAAVLAMAAPLAARAQGKLDAAYRVTLAGIPIGKGTWTIEISDTHYTAAAAGAATGLMKVFTGGHGVSSASGTLLAGQPLSSIYVSTIFSHKKADAIRLSVEKGNVKELKLDPPQDDDPHRVPITEAHQHGILDPMTASLMRTPGTGDPVSAEACERTLAIFDGHVRYDLQLAFKRIEQVKAEKGYSGPVAVCAVFFTPIAGYVPSRMAIRYISERRDMEVWLAPIAGTRVLVPYRAEGPTPIGPVVFEATQFVSLAGPIRASVGGSKTQ